MFFLWTIWYKTVKKIPFMLLVYLKRQYSDITAVFYWKCLNTIPFIDIRTHSYNLYSLSTVESTSEMNRMALQSKICMYGEDTRLWDPVSPEWFVHKICKFTAHSLFKAAPMPLRKRGVRKGSLSFQKRNSLWDCLWLSQMIFEVHIHWNMSFWNGNRRR